MVLSVNAFMFQNAARFRWLLIPVPSFLASGSLVLGSLVPGYLVTVSFVPGSLVLLFPVLL